MFSEEATSNTKEGIVAPKVSVIIATHSRPHLLPRAVESAKTAGRDVEVIVVDDASTDETSEVCKSLTGIKYIRVDRNQKVAGARNIGILASTGEYISFLDDDDMRLPGSLDAQVELLEADKEAGFVYGQALFANQDGEIIDSTRSPDVCTGGDLFWTLMATNFICCLTVVFRKSCLLRVGILDNLPGIDDWDLWVRIAELYPAVPLQKPVAIWRKSTPNSLQGTSDLTGLLRAAFKTRKNKWSKLPRVVNAPEEQVERSDEIFLRIASNNMLNDIYTTLAARHYSKALNKILTLILTNPISFTKPYTIKVILAGLLTRFGIKKEGYHVLHSAESTD